jgi:quinol monooxygenase YgiN
LIPLQDLNKNENSMLAIIYRFHLKPEQESHYQSAWDILTDYFIKCRGSLGSALHKSENGLWIAYSRWPDRATRDASWSESAVLDSFSETVRKAIQVMQEIKKENENLEQYEELTMNLIYDKLK